ncbi:MAG: hypothetical protein IPL25_13255 [Saprospiraceae bacterium]|nr:hypothetical protein [Candidatus Vicinibacter affinis]
MVTKQENDLAMYTKVTTNSQNRIFLTSSWGAIPQVTSRDDDFPFQPGGFLTTLVQKIKPMLILLQPLLKVVPKYLKTRPLTTLLLK